jgi:hypothetical protein
MIDALMAVWNRRRGHGIKLILALLLIAISMALVLTTFGINTNNSIADHVTGTARHTEATATAATATPAATAKTGEVISVKTVTPTVVLKKKPMTQPCVAKTAKWSTGPFNGVSESKKHKATPTAHPRPSPTPAISPTVEPTGTPVGTPVEPTATEEDTPTPEPTEEITPVTSPTAVSTLPPEPTIIVLITPTAVAIETSTSEATAISGDATTTPTPDLDDEKASLAAHVLHQPTEKPGTTTIVGGSANCLRNSVDRPVDGMQGLAVNLVIVLGSILPGILLFYGALCAVYMLRQRGARGKQQDVKWE